MEEGTIARNMTCFAEGMEGLHDPQQQHQQESVMDGNTNMGMVCAPSQQQHQHQSFSYMDEDRSNDHHNETIWSPRLKWGDDMVRLLIQAVCLVDEDSDRNKVEDGNRNKSRIKWSCISRIMLEKGFRIFPDQCKDKFNDLNKKFKRLNDFLGEDTSKVVENPALLDFVDGIFKETKEEIKKTMCFKHLFYQEMCSYHKANNLYIAADFDHEALFAVNDENGEDDEDNASTEWKQQNSSRISRKQRPRMRVQVLSLKKQKVEIQSQALELEKERFKWQKISSKKNRELKKLKLEIEKMKLENERVQLQLRQK